MQAKIGVIGYYASKLKLITGKGKKETCPYVEMSGVLCRFAFLSSHPSLIVWVPGVRLMAVDKRHGLTDQLSDPMAKLLLLTSS